MDSIRNIPIQKLFIITIFLKVLSSTIGWAIGSPWILGLAVPLTIMVAYIVLGIYRVDRDVSDEKFADSCYYLGFIFTITSIIFSLFDLPSIGTKLPEIAVRFGAAMVSTVFGLVVRVYLVSFKKDIADAVEAAEETVIEAANRFGDQLNMVIEKLQQYQVDVDLATRKTVDNVAVQLDEMSKTYEAQLTGFFAGLQQKNSDTNEAIFTELKQTSARVAGSLDLHTRSMNTNLQSVQVKVDEFSEAVTTRLRNTTFPDDFFAKNLGAAMSSLRENIDSVSAGVSNVATEIQETNASLSVVTKSLRIKATGAERSISTIAQVADGQERILAQAQAQIEALSALSGGLKNFETTLSNVVEALGEQSSKTDKLSEGMAGAVGLGNTLSKLDCTLTVVVTQLEAQREATKDMNAKIGGLLDKTLELAHVVASTSSKVDDATDTIPVITGAVHDMRQELGSFGEHFARFGGSLSSLTEKLGGLEINAQLPALIQHALARTDGEPEEGKHMTSMEMRPLPSSLT